MSDEFARIAQLEAELDQARQRCRCRQSSGHEHAAALGRAIVGMDDVSRYLGGVLRSELVDAADELGTAMRKERAEFEAKVLSALDRIEANQSMVVQAYQDLVPRVTRLEQMAHAPLHAINGGKGA